MGGQAPVVGVVVSLRVEVSRVEVSRVPPHVVPVGLQEAELRVVQDVEVGAAQAVVRRPHQEVAVVFTALPPDGKVEGGAAQLEAGRQEGVSKNLRDRPLVLVPVTGGETSRLLDLKEENLVRKFWSVTYPD